MILRFIWKNGRKNSNQGLRLLATTPRSSGAGSGVRGEGVQGENLSSVRVPYDFPGGSEVKASASNAGDPGLIPGSGSSPGEGNGTPLQYPCLENPMDGEAW